jgi:type II secretory pathway pseudopilin PulG
MRTLLAHAREENSWFAVELMVVIAIVGLLNGIGLTSYVEATAKFRTIEASFLLGGIRVNVQEFRALHGRWPDENEIVLNGVPRHREAIPGLKQNVVAAELAAGGAISLTFTAEALGTTGHLMYRPAVTTHSSSATIWVCGYSTPPRGFAAPAANSTDILPEMLPAACRDTQNKI